MGKTGWGHKLVPGENYTVISIEKAESLLSADINRTWGSISGSIKKPLTANQQAAVLCFAFNVGAGAFIKSTLLKHINAGDMTAAANEFDKWNKATIGGQLVAVAGLTARRADEKRIFLT